MISSLVSLKEFKAYTDISLSITRERKLLSFALIECMIDLKKIVQWNLDLTKGQGTGKICSLFRGFVISKFFSLYGILL